MRPSLELLEKVDLYLQGMLSSEETHAFEQEKLSNPELAHLVDRQQLIQQAILRKALLAEVIKHAPASGGSFFKLYRWPLSILAIAVITVLAILYNPFSDSGKVTGPPTVTPTKLFGQSELSSKTKPLELCGTPWFSQENPVILLNNIIVEQPISEPPKKIGGLQTWVQPEIQVFTINPSQSNTIECKEGTLIIVPGSGICHTNGQLATGPVQIEVIEALTIDKMIAYNLITVAGNKPLSSGGMVYIQPKQGDELLTFGKDTPCHVEIPTDNYNPDMLSWDGVPQNDGSLDWQNPQALERFLVPVDFATLDFVPDGFRPTFRSLLPFQNLKSSTPEREDSMYYSLSTTANQPVSVVVTKSSPKVQEPERTDGYPRVLKITDFPGESIPENSTAQIQYGKGLKLTSTIQADGKVVFYTPMSGNLRCSATLQFPGCDPIRYSDIWFSEDKITFVKLEPNECFPVELKAAQASTCYIDPASIKAIREPAFAKTYIATREFEERLQALHRIPNAQEYLELYIKNIKEDLYLTDKMVAQAVNGEHKEVFNNFAAQQLTNVRNAHTFSNELTDFYNKKRKEFRAEEQKKEQQFQQKSTATLRQREAELQKLQDQYVLAESKGRSSGNSQNTKVLRRSLPTAPSPSVATQDNYKLTWYKPGWKNIDCYMHELEKGERIITIRTGELSRPQSVYQCINSLKMVLGLNKGDRGFQAHYPAASSVLRDKFSSTYSIGINRNPDGTVAYGEAVFDPYTTSTVDLKWERVSEEQLLERLKDLSLNNLDLIKSLKSEMECVRKELAIRKKQEEVLAEQKRLADLAAKKAAFIQALEDSIDPCKQGSGETKTESRDPIEASGNEVNVAFFPAADALYQGGNYAMNVFIMQELQYPQEAIDQQLMGTVHVRFEIDETGQLSNAHIPYPDPKLALLEEEALRIVRRMPNWKPAESDGKPVRSILTIPIQFSLK